MANYEESTNIKLDWAMPFQRTGKFPLDRSSMFSSLADAIKYAKGDTSDPDSRELCGSSYIGQQICVYENDEVNYYKIDADRTLKSLSNLTDSITSASADDQIPSAKAVYELNCPIQVEFSTAKNSGGVYSPFKTDGYSAAEIKNLTKNKKRDFDCIISSDEMPQAYYHFGKARLLAVSTYNKDGTNWKAGNVLCLFVAKINDMNLDEYDVTFTFLYESDSSASPTKVSIVKYQKSLSTLDIASDNDVNTMITEVLGSYSTQQQPSSIILNSNTIDSTKQFELTIDDTGTLTSQEL